MKSILDPSFQYTPSANTDLRKTFARVRKEMRRRQRSETESAAKVAPLFDGLLRAGAKRAG